MQQRRDSSPNPLCDCRHPNSPSVFIGANRTRGYVRQKRVMVALAVPPNPGKYGKNAVGGRGWRGQVVCRSPLKVGMRGSWQCATLLYITSFCLFCRERPAGLIMPRTIAGRRGLRMPGWRPPGTPLRMRPGGSRQDLFRELWSANSDMRGQEPPWRRKVSRSQAPGIIKGIIFFASIFLLLSGSFPCLVPCCLFLTADFYLQMP